MPVVLLRPASSPRVRWRPSSWPSPTGTRSSPLARAGGASRRYSAAVLPRRSCCAPRPGKELEHQVEPTVAPPGVAKIIAADISFALESGQALAIIGPSGSGKSSLARLLVGAWQPVRGKVRFDGAALDQWSSEQRGRHIGYLPQDVELFSGTVAQNICRFDPDARPDPS